MRLVDWIGHVVGLRQKIADSPPEKCARCAELESTNEKLSLQIAELERKVAELTERLAGDSSNTHRPPSSDGPDKKKPERKRKKSGRKPGGQPGHNGKARELLPTEKVSEVHPVKPDACQGCGASLSGLDENPRRHQVTEIPPITVQVTEYQLHALACTECGDVTRASLPSGVPSGAFGPRLQAFVGLFTGTYRLSRRNAKQLFRDAFGVMISLGSIVNVERRVSEVLELPVEEAKEAIRTQPVVGADETGWWLAGKRAWLWVAVSRVATVFLVRAQRSSAVAKELLGPGFTGILGSDRWSAYYWVDVLHRQLCWAHLIRDFKRISESETEDVATIGQKLLRCSDQLFAWWHRVRDGTLKRSSFRVYVSGLRQEMKSVLLEGSLCAHKKSAGFCKNLLKLEPALWTFVRHEGVDPTNNGSERALRYGVIWRKTSFGCQTEAGARYVERMLTTRATVRQHGRSVMDYLTAAMEARNRSNPAPSLPKS